MIDHEKKIIFIHIPKCGGSSIEKILFHDKKTPENLFGSPTEEQKRNFKMTTRIRTSAGLQHMMASDISNEVGLEVFNNFFKFAFVRNPFDRILSHFFWSAHSKNYQSLLGLPSDNFSFKNYINAVSLHLKSNHIHPHFRSQHEFINDSNKNLLVNFIGRIENLQEDFNIVCDKIGIPHQELPHVNKSQHKHYTEYYDDETREIVANKYKKDIEYFGYKFGD